MKIAYLGHSAFILNFDGVQVVTDPYDSRVGYEMPFTEADIVTCSHFHDDHHWLGAIKGAYTLLDTPSCFTLNGLSINSYSSYHDDKQGAQRGTNLVFQFSYNGHNMVHMGDIGESAEKFDLPVKNIDILFIPIGGKYTIDPLTAKHYCDKINPRFIVPMHYRLPDTAFPLAKIEEFTQYFTNDQVCRIGGWLDVAALTQVSGKKVILFESQHQ